MKVRSLLFLILIVLSVSCKEESVNHYDIIPAPSSLEMGSGSFVIKENTMLVVNTRNEKTEGVITYITGFLRNAGYKGLDVVERQGVRRGSINLILDEEGSFEPEGYALSIKRNIITIRASDGAGLFYGFQTMRQLLPPSVELNDEGAEVPALHIPVCEIKDQPAFIYRGMHLDVGRHMFPVEYIERYIDMMALHKMNMFHWHLTEDQGWRIEIDKYPLLTEVGSKRKETIVGHAGRPPFEYDGKPYEGFYTKEQVRDIVAYAAERFITVIPEIEMPGHSLAAITAYPHISCTGGPFEVATKWGVFEDVYCAGKEETFAFLEDVIDEVTELFPGPYFHIGGDECPKSRWKVCPDCQKRMVEEGLADEHELQSYFVKRIESYLATKGKRMIGWDEILEGGLAPQATVMSWRGTQGGIAAAREGHDVIMTPNPYMYLDHYQTEPEGEPLAIGGYSPLEWVYGYDPVPAELSGDEVNFILGLQGNLWSEYLYTPEQMEYMAYPRMFAIAETGWTAPLKKDFEDFLVRFTAQRARYDVIGINYFKGDYRNTRGRGRQ